MQSLVPAFSNISKLIFNNDQALLPLVQNYDYLQTKDFIIRSTPDMKQEKLRKIMTKDRFISISLSLSSLIKSQTEGTDIHPPTEFNLEKQFAIMSAYCLSKVHTIHAPDLLQLLSR